MRPNVGLIRYWSLWIVAWLLVVILAGLTGVVHADSWTPPGTFTVSVESPYVEWRDSPPFQPPQLDVRATNLQPVYVTSAAFLVYSTTSYGITVEAETWGASGPFWDNTRMNTDNKAVRAPDSTVDAFDIAVYNGDAAKQDPSVGPWSPFQTAENTYWATGGGGFGFRPRNTAFSDSDDPHREHYVVVALVLMEQEKVENPYYDGSDPDQPEYLGSTAAWHDDHPRFLELPGTEEGSEHSVLVTVTITQEPR